jgi:hypothetical protein
MTALQISVDLVQLRCMDVYCVPAHQFAASALLGTITTILKLAIILASPALWGAAHARTLLTAQHALLVTTFLHLLV